MMIVPDRKVAVALSSKASDGFITGFFRNRNFFRASGFENDVLHNLRSSVCRGGLF